MKNKLSIRQLCLIILLFFSISKMYFLPSTLANICEEDSWIACLINLSIDLIFFCIFISLSDKYDGKDFYSIICQTINEKTAKAIYFIFAIFLIIKVFIPISEQIITIQVALYDSSPSILFFVALFVFLFYASTKGINALGRSCEFTIYLDAVAFFIIVFLAIPSSDYVKILPIGGSGINIFDASYKTFFWFGDSIYFLLLLGYFKKEKGWKVKTILTYSITILITVFLILTFYAVFDCLSKKQFFAIIRISKYSISLSDIGRIDYLANFIICSISAFQIAFGTCVASKCLDKALNISRVFISPLIVSIILGVLTFAFKYKMPQVLIFYETYLSLIFIIISYFIPLIIYFLPKRRKHEIQPL